VTAALSAVLPSQWLVWVQALILWTRAVSDAGNYHTPALRTRDDGVNHAARPRHKFLTGYRHPVTCQSVLDKFLQDVKAAFAARFEAVRLRLSARIGLRHTIFRAVPFFRPPRISNMVLPPFNSR